MLLILKERISIVVMTSSEPKKHGFTKEQIQAYRNKAASAAGRYCFPPDSFETPFIVQLLKLPTSDFIEYRKYQFTCGLVLKLKNATVRVYKRTKYPPPTKYDTDAQRMFHLLRLCTIDIDIVDSNWTVQSIWDLAEELTRKQLNLNPPLQKVLMEHPVVRTTSSSLSLIDWNIEFLRKVSDYHAAVKRPEGAFHLEDKEVYSILASQPRHLCPGCQNYRQLYCGVCHGRLMTGVAQLLGGDAERIDLPFKVMLLMHWQESLIKCTGIHIGALCTPGTLEVTQWVREKTSQDWDRIVAGLDPTRDVLLFPCEAAVDAEDFKWGQIEKDAHDDHDGDQDVIQLEIKGQTRHAKAFTSNSTGSEANGSSKSPSLGKPETSQYPNKWRLVVLEGSWNYATTMANQIIEYRSVNNLKPLPCVMLHGLTGEYWRFHHKGHSSVSTIEAIAHTAHAAGLSHEKKENLLTFFRVQKLRVLQKIEDGGKVPRAVEVTGTGLGSWKPLTDALSDLMEGTISLQSKPTSIETLNPAAKGSLK